MLPHWYEFEMLGHTISVLCKTQPLTGKYEADEYAVSSPDGTWLDWEKLTALEHQVIVAACEIYKAEADEAAYTADRD